MPPRPDGLRLGELELKGSDGFGAKGEVPAGPLYRRIAGAIRQRVAEGRLGEGERLPPIRVLARQLGVNRDTVAMAYELLASEGLVDAQAGRGTFVRARSRPARPLLATALAPAVERLLDLERSLAPTAACSEAIPLHSLVPDPSLYPAAEFRRALSRALARGGAGLLAYAGASGHPGLREVLLERLGRRGVASRADELVLCHGASEGIELVLRLFTEAGDAVAVESPTYPNVLAAITGLGLRPAPVPMRLDGVDLAALAQVLGRPEVKLFYTIPTFHNPMGVTTEVSHRRALLELAARAGKPVIEDAFEADLRFAGRPRPPLAALDRHGLVVHLFSFSKSLFPGARVGAIVAPGRAAEGLRALQMASDLGGSLLLQAAVAEFVASGAYDRHLARLRRTLRSRCAVLIEELERRMPPGTSFTRPEGGYQVWVELPRAIDTRELLAEALREGVCFAPGWQFRAEGGRSNALRLTVSRADERCIRAGVERLARAVRRALRAGPPRVQPRPLPL